jgi:hypothetical protein
MKRRISIAATSGPFSPPRKHIDYLKSMKSNSLLHALIRKAMWNRKVSTCGRSSGDLCIATSWTHWHLSRLTNICCLISSALAYSLSFEQQIQHRGLDFVLVFGTQDSALKKLCIFCHWKAHAGLVLEVVCMKSRNRTKAPDVQDMFLYICAAS